MRENTLIALSNHLPQSIGFPSPLWFAHHRKGIRSRAHCPARGCGFRHLRHNIVSNGFSKKLENHVAAVALYVAHHNLCRVHEALRITTAMQLGLTDHVWTIAELVDAALD